jgi:hypothetical protein
VGVCSTVKVLAEFVNKRRPSDPRQFLLLQLLQLMPAYSALHDLSAWEAAFLEVESSKQSPKLNDNTSKAISLIFEFGRFNLYSAFEVEKTKTELASLQKKLAGLGIQVHGNFNVSDW